MLDRRISRWLLFSVSLLLLGTAIFFLFQRERKVCLGVMVLDDTEKIQELEYVYTDFSEYLLYQGEQAPIDIESSTIYLSQEIQENTVSWQLNGELTLNNACYQMYFLPDAYFQNLSDAVRQGHAFDLIITDEAAAYMQYHVVFTTLPVISMDGKTSYVNEDARDVMDGEICVWEPSNRGTGRYTTTSHLEWHVRGRSTAGAYKRSWKLSLKTKDGENQNISLLNMGADDDWILNAMYMDDGKVKEKLVMELWNDLAAQTDWNYPMSTGEYVEVVINGEYRGLYLLQRRVDQKYLGTEKEDILLKPTPMDEEPYEIVSSPIEYDEIITLMNDLWAGGDSVSIDLNNFIDISVFLQYGALLDNAAQNVIYVMQREEDKYKLSMDLWDTDMSFGVIWSNEARSFVYDYEESMATYCY